MTESEEFSDNHKDRQSSFTRERKLPFKSVLQLLLRKSVKSLQLILNEWSSGFSISASALSQARQKFKHTAFIELHEECVTKVMYGDGDYDTYKGYRLLALDGTTLRLPTSKESRKEFGVVKYMNGKRAIVNNQVEAKAAILYDVLNRIPVSSNLFPGRTNDIKAGKEALEVLTEKDILVADRGYGGYQFFADIIDKKANFIVRLKDKTYDKYHNLFSDSDTREKIVEIPKPYVLRDDSSIPDSIKIRLIRIVLSSGEIEVLATSLLDKEKFPYKHFKVLYRKRWEIETYFLTLKSRLSIDNFTGKSKEAILQDFYSTIFISGLETILTEEANQKLKDKNVRNPQKVNKAVSFHAIKNKIIALMFEKPTDFEEQVLQLFLQNPTAVREERPPSPRTLNKHQNRNSMYFQRYARKHVF